MQRNSWLFFSIILATLAVSFLLFMVNSQPSLAKPEGDIVSSESVNWQKLHPDLIRLLADQKTQEMIPLIVEWKRDETTLNLLSEQAFQSIKEQRERVVSILKEEAEFQTMGILQTLHAAQRQGKVREIRPFWVSPMISLKADLKFIQSLSNRDDVVFIRPDERIELNVSPAIEVEYPSASNLIYNLDRLWCMKS